MSRATRTGARNAWALAASLAGAVGMAACDRSPPPEATPPSAVPSEFSETVPPPILEPEREADAVPEPPSYEVAIASAAAVRNEEKEKCAELSGDDRKACEEKVEADFSAATTDLSRLRGNQQ